LSPVSLPAIRSSLTLDERILVACARVELSESTRLSILDAAREQVDWKRLLDAARYHEFEPLLWRHLSRVGSDRVPPEILDTLEAESRRISLRNLSLAAELAGILGVLQAEGIHATCLKGPAAAVAYYGDLGLRSFLDLDVLVPKGDARTAWRLLCDRGYAPRFALGPDWQELVVRRGSEELFRHAASGRLVDLHWQLWPPGYTFTPGSDGPWAARESVRIASADIDTLGAEAAVLFFCLHGVKHSWVGLKWVCDLSEVLRSRPGLDWQVVLDWSSPPGRRRLIDLGLRLAHELLDAPVPREVLARGAKDPKVVEMAREAARGLLSFDGPPQSIWSTVANPLYRRAMGERRDRLRFLHDAILAPTPHEWKLVPLPAALAPLYYAIRPVRLAWKHAPWRSSRE